MTAAALTNVILIAEADPSTAKLLAELVLQIDPNAQVVSASNGSEALHLCQQPSVKLIIADSDLPTLSGLELLRQVRRKPSLVELPFILLSARVDAASVRAARPLKPSAYVAKPINNVQLAQRIETILNSSRSAAKQRPKLNTNSLDAYLKDARSNTQGAPLLAGVSEAVQQCMNRDKPDLRQLEQCYSSDPQITARLIAVANSAAQHQGTPCQTLAQALPRLGHARALNLALTLAVQRQAQLSEPRLVQLAETTWQTAQHSAELAQWLGQKLRADSELCYTAGLLHNIGELALLRSLQLWIDAEGELSDEQLSHHFAQTAAPFGSALRIQWRLPLGLREAIAAFYHLGSGVFSREALVLNLAGEVLRLDRDQPLSDLQEQRCVRLLRLPSGLLETIPRDASPRLNG